MATIAQPLTDQSNPPKQAPLTLTDGAIAKVREIMATQDPASGRSAHWRGRRRMLRLPVLHVL